MLQLKIITGDLLEQKVDVIINPWNRNIIPWWLLLPQGVSGVIKKCAGCAPFRELAKAGPIPLGGAVLTGAGRMPYKGIIHVAGINMFWRATEFSISRSVLSAMKIVADHHFGSVAFPIIGAGSGSFDKDKAVEIMLDQLNQIDDDVEVLIVKFEKKS